MDLIPPLIIVGVIVILDSALSIDAKRGFRFSCSRIISSTFSAEGLCSIANVERCSNKLVLVSLSGSYSSSLCKSF